MPYTITVNGKSTTVDVPADMPLLWVLRDVLNLRARSTAAASAPAAPAPCTSTAAGALLPDAGFGGGERAITTIEGLSADGTHPRAAGLAWSSTSPQCGYCQAGQIMSAAALLAAATPKPTDADIDTAMSGNLCRCGTYMRIRAGIHRAAALAGQARRRARRRAGRRTGVSHGNSRLSSPRLPPRHRARRRRPADR